MLSRQAKFLMLMVLVALPWAGLILGVSFIATPIKFTASSIDYNEALDLGQVTFGLFGPIEMLLSILLGILLFFGRRHQLLGWLGIMSLMCILFTLVENFGLRPLLDARLSRILAGEPVEPSSMHLIYVVLQGAKVLLLIGTAIQAIKTIIRETSSAERP